MFMCLYLDEHAGICQFLDLAMWPCQAEWEQGNENRGIGEGQMVTWKKKTEYAFDLVRKVLIFYVSCKWV